MKSHVRLSDIRGYSRLAVDATIGLTNLVESMHRNITRLPGILGAATHEPTTGITGLVYRSIRGVTRLVGGSIDAVLAQLVPLLSEVPSSTEREAVVAALNGVLGDHIAVSANPLAIPMRRKVLVQQLRYAHPLLLGQQERNVVYSFGNHGKCIGHADKLTPISKARRKMGEC